MTHTAIIIGTIISTVSVFIGMGKEYHKLPLKEKLRNCLNTVSFTFFCLMLCIILKS